ncbi:MAG: CoA pyrophosphatase [Myxococcales bacterium]|nr:CoA pyrophosphatase [Myxococcales bacterium]
MDLDAVRRALEARSPEEREAHERAAVAAILRDAGFGPEVLLIRRAEREGDPWSGHMALPGGRHEPADRDLRETALRETREELGLDLSGARLLGRLDDVETHRPGLVVRPFVFEVQGDAPTLAVPNREVAEAVWAPLSPLVRGERDAHYLHEHPGGKVRFPAYDVEGRIVWGLTYRMLQILFSLAR